MIDLLHKKYQNPNALASVQKGMERMEEIQVEKNFERFFEPNPQHSILFVNNFILYRKTIYYISPYVYVGLVPMKSHVDMKTVVGQFLPPSCVGNEELFWESFKAYMYVFFNKRLRAGQCIPQVSWQYYWYSYCDKNCIKLSDVPSELHLTFKYKNHLLSYISQTSTARYLTKETFYAILPIRPSHKLGKKLYDSLYALSGIRKKKPFVRIPESKRKTDIPSDYQPTEPCTRMIEQLCHDRITLQNLGRLFENLSSTEPYKQVIILRLPNTPDKKKSAEMFDLLCRRVYGLGTYQTSSLRTLDQNKNLEPYINFEFSPFSCTVLNHPKVGKVGEITYRKLTKLFFGKRITFSDSFFGSETFYNSTPTVCMVYSDAQAEKIKNIFPSTILHLDSFDKLDPEDITSLSSDDCDFLYGTLPSLFEEGEQTKTATADEQHIRCFMGKYTRNAKDSFVYAAELYEAYTRYMERESGSEPLSSIRFGKKIRFLYSYDYYKPHKSRNTPNQYAYRGMALRTDKIKELLEKPLYQKSDMTVSQIINQRLKERSKSAD